MLINIKKRKRSLYDQLRIYSLDITIIATLLLLFAFLGATTYLYMNSETALKTQKAQREYFEQKDESSEWKRIDKQQSYPPAVTKGEQQTPYSQDKEGGNISVI